MEAQPVRICLPDGSHLEAQGVSIERPGEPVRIDFGRTIDGSPFPGGIIAPQSWIEIQMEEELVRLRGKGTRSWVFIFQHDKDMATLFPDIEGFMIGPSSIVLPVGWQSIHIEGIPFVCLTKGMSNVFKCPTKGSRRQRSREIS